MKLFLKRVGIITGLVIGLIVLGMLLLYGAGRMRLNKKYEVPIVSVAIPNDPESLAEGKRIFQYRGCEACHGEHLQGLVYLDNPALGQVITPNLTTGQGGIGSLRTDEDLVRAMRASPGHRRPHPARPVNDLFSAGFSSREFPWSSTEENLACP